MDFPPYVYAQKSEENNYASHRQQTDAGLCSQFSTARLIQMCTYAHSSLPLTVFAEIGSK